MTKRSSGLAGAFVLLTAAIGAWGCSSAETPEPSDGTGGTSGGSSGSGGAAPGTGGGTSGTPGTGGGGTAGTGGGTAGSGGGTAGSGGSTGGACVVSGTPVTPPVAPAECRGIRSNMACPTAGVMCMGLACGLADTGRRDCSCDDSSGMPLWTCTSCDLTMSPFLTRPECTPVCGIQADGQPCTEQGAVCDNAAGGEACACWPDDEGVPIWDCDRPPWASGS